MRSYENQLRENEIAHTKGAIQCKYTEELLQIQWLEHTGLDQGANYGRVWGSDPELSLIWRLVFCIIGLKKE